MKKTIGLSVLWSCLIMTGSCGDSNGSSPTGPGTAVTLSETGSFVPPGVIVYVEDVCVSGNYAYIADTFPNTPGNEYFGMYIVNITNPSAPTQASFFLRSNTVCIEVSGNYAFLGASGRLRVVDVTNPVAPAEIGAYSPATVTDMEIAGEYVYAADKTNGLLVVDVSNKTNPSLIGMLDLPGNRAQAIAIDGMYAYVVDGDSGLFVVNVSNPASPVLTGFYTKPSVLVDGGYEDVVVGGNFAYVGDIYGIRVFDVSSKSAPQRFAEFDTPGAGGRLRLDGNRLFMAGRSDGIVVMDVSAPATPKILTTFDTPGLAYDLTLAGGYVYVADYDAGLRILKIQ